MKITFQQQRKIVEIAKKFSLDLVILFGSQTRGKTMKESDIDIGVFSMKGKIGFQKTLDLYAAFSKIFGDRTDIADLGNAGPLLRFEAAKKGRVLFEKTKGKFTEFKVHAARDYYDFEPYFKLEEANVKKSLHYFQKKYA